MKPPHECNHATGLNARDAITGIYYEVSAIIPEPRVADAWQAWIVHEHIADVIAAGAARGRLVRIDTAVNAPRQYCVQYDFSSREALDHYLACHAPRLREEGLKRFPADQVTYARRTGVIM